MLLTVPEVALRLRVSKDTVYRWMRMGLIEYVCLCDSRRRLIAEEEVGRVIQAGTRKRPRQRTRELLQMR